MRSKWLCLEISIRYFQIQSFANILLLQIRINSNIKFDIRNIWQRKGDVAFRGVPNNFEWIFILSGGKRPQHQM